MICSYFLPFYGLLFALLMVSFNAQKFSVLMESNLFFPLLSVVLVLRWLGMFWLHMTNATNLNRNCFSECKEKFRFRSRPRSDMVRSTNYNDAISTLSFYIIAPDFLFFFKFFFFLATPGLSCDLWDRNPDSLHWECRVLTTGPPGKFLSSAGLLHSHPSPFQKHQASMALMANNPGRETFMLIPPKAWGRP